MQGEKYFLKKEYFRNQACHIFTIVGFIFLRLNQFVALFFRSVDCPYSVNSTWTASTSISRKLIFASQTPREWGIANKNLAIQLQAASQKPFPLAIISSATLSAWLQSPHGPAHMCVWPTQLCFLPEHVGFALSCPDTLPVDISTVTAQLSSREKIEVQHLAGHILPQCLAIGLQRSKCASGLD